VRSQIWWSFVGGFRVQWLKKAYWELSQFCVCFCSFIKLTGWVCVFICQKKRKRPIFDEIRATNRTKKIPIKNRDQNEKISQRQLHKSKKKAWLVLAATERLGVPVCSRLGAPNLHGLACGRHECLVIV
jgi:hypothetical protein